MSRHTLKDGGPAFPVNTGHTPDGGCGHQTGNTTWQFPGMTLHDYFVAAAIQGICAHNDTWGLQVAEIGTKAHEIADSALKARSQS